VLSDKFIFKNLNYTQNNCMSCKCKVKTKKYGNEEVIQYVAVAVYKSLMLAVGCLHKACGVPSASGVNKG